ncbi:MAG TPA: helix-turn-helix transcriptional regulator [Streptosporangiaceae bacterium]|nr:helix-turn-helix transcriptional regulator [Streptosporangiaceae bacterium]
MSFSVDSQTYVHDLEEQLRLILFGGGGSPDAQAAVLLVRGALADGDRSRAAWLAKSTQQLAEARPGHRDMAAAAAHARGLVDRDSARLEQAAGTYTAPLARAKATEDAGLAWADRGNQDNAVAWLREAYALYEQLGTVGSMARVRSQLRAAGVRLHHWKRADKPAYGWESLTETEQRIADLVAQGLSNRQVAARLFLSTHTVAFHLRHIYWKLDVNSRVQLARLAAEQAQMESALTGAGSRQALPGLWMWPLARQSNVLRRKRHTNLLVQEACHGDASRPRHQAVTDQRRPDAGDRGHLRAHGATGKRRIRRSWCGSC